MNNFCGHCGAAIAPESSFCNRCGRAVAPRWGDAPTEQQPVFGPGNDLEPPGRGPIRRHPVVVALVTVVIVAAALVPTLLLVGRDHPNDHQTKVAGTQRPSRSTTPTTAAPATTTAAPTTTTVNPAVVQAQQQYRDYGQRLENVLQQSASGRSQVASLVAGVVNGCTVTPYDASAGIRTVIENRTSLLNQLSAMSAAPNAEAQHLYSLLQQALQASINADIQYQAWMDFLYTDYYYTFPIGCPEGGPPQNGAFSAARAADAQATSLKTQFVAAFDPVAERFGLPTWQADGF